MASFSKDELEEIFNFSIVSEPVVQKVIGATSHEYWEKRGGMDGYKRSANNLSEFYEYRKRELAWLEDLPGNISREQEQQLSVFFVQVYALVHAILRIGYEDILATPLHTAYIKNRTFYFILGAPRTGGHYLLKELHTCLEIDFESLSPQFSTDAVLGEETAYFWDRPNYFIRFLKEFCSFIVWADMSYPENGIVIKKSLRLAGAMKALDYLMKGRASYIVPVRHPQGCFESLRDLYRDSINTIGEDWTGRYLEDAVFRAHYLDNSLAPSAEERFLNYWKNIYYEIIKDGAPHGKIYLINYGKAVEGFVHQFAQERNPGFDRNKIGKFNIRERRSPHGFWHSEKVEKAIEEVRTVWRIHGYDFPSARELMY